MFSKLKTKKISLIELLPYGSFPLEDFDNDFGIDEDELISHGIAQEQEYGNA